MSKAISFRLSAVALRSIQIQAPKLPALAWRQLAEDLADHFPVSDYVIAFDCLQVSFAGQLPARAILPRLSEFCQNWRYRPSSIEPRQVVVPVYYSQQSGADLASLAERTELSPEAIVDCHTSQTYQVAAVGFQAGFAYLEGLASVLHTPRHSTPRARVPAGSVAIANGQCAIYPQASPGGWNLIGRTPVPQAWLNELDSLLKVGDTLVFEAISQEQYLSMGGELD
ncbi:5-oxoprolinase subunit B family protein [Paraferrimonas sedimenticola]|uniref:Carboxyltransferase domain-containing protein n=1 Tax=Paraferrimonas sedimenticola TaxID=375674 RepID=A0AA37RVK5_9GAMM|nr:carboxyltransferase domain-containing protein [Paraferrimonas sedimenticola]GLP95993.1 hypothetical protein GCM10007895_12990 [Paraferrimonas sedimenticola]